MTKLSLCSNCVTVFVAIGPFTVHLPKSLRVIEFTARFLRRGPGMGFGCIAAWATFDLFTLCWTRDQMNIAP